MKSEEQLRTIAVSLGIDPKEVETPAQVFKWANDYAGVNSQTPQSVKNLKENPSQWLKVHELAHASDEKPPVEEKVAPPIKKGSPLKQDAAKIANVKATEAEIQQEEGDIPATVQQAATQAAIDKKKKEKKIAEDWSKDK
jgi:hypothetical protein